jgi:hypothetical protein
LSGAIWEVNVRFVTPENLASREKSMQREILRPITLGVITLVVALTVAPGLALQAQAQDAKTPYPNMAPPEQYLTERNTEIALARSAAPESISRDAEMMVLGRHGYEIAAEGKNGFVCMVERTTVTGTGIRT